MVPVLFTYTFLCVSKVLINVNRHLCMDFPFVNVKCIMKVMNM